MEVAEVQGQTKVVEVVLLQENQGEDNGKDL